MTTWYEKTFGRDYLSLYPHRNDAEASEDIAHLLKLMNLPRNERLLDLCCGAGRHLFALHRAGFTELTGLDLSEDLLTEARHRLAAHDITGIQLLKADMREIPAQQPYSTILSLFTSFGYFADQYEDERVLASAYRALSPNGNLILDTLNREYVLASLVPAEEKDLGEMHISIRRHITQDGLRVEKETRVTRAHSPEAMYQESVRMYRKQEIEDMLARIGFVKPRFFGSLQGQPFSDSSPRMVFTTSKAAE